MTRRIVQVALLVRDYDEAIEWYSRAFGFVLLEDSDLGNGKRWVRIAPESRRLADDVMPQLVMDFQDLQHQIMPCESVATGQ